MGWTKESESEGGELEIGFDVYIYIFLSLFSICHCQGLMNGLGIDGIRFGFGSVYSI